MRSFQISQGLCILKLQATLRDNTSSYEMYFRGLDQLKKTTVISCTKTTLFKKSLHWRVGAKGVSMLRQAIRITTCNQKPIWKDWKPVPWESRSVYIMETNSCSLRTSWATRHLSTNLSLGQRPKGSRQGFNVRLTPTHCIVQYV